MSEAHAPLAVSGDADLTGEAYDVMSLGEDDFAAQGGDAASAEPEVAAEPDEVADEQPEQPQAPDQFQMFQQFAAQQQQQFAALLERQNQQQQQLIQSLVERLAPQAAPVDPFAELDPNDPDYTFKQLQIQNQLLQQKLDQLEGKVTTTEKQRQEELQRQQQQAQIAQLTAWRDDNVTKAANLLFAGFPQNKLVDQAKDTVAVRFDAEWRALSEQQYGVPYHKDAYATAFNRIKPQLALYTHLKAAKPAAAAQRATGAPQAQQQAAQRAPAAPGPFVPYFERKSGR